MKCFACWTLATLFVAQFALSVRAGDSVRLAEGSGKQVPKQPQAAVDSEGHVHVTFGVGEQVYHTRSQDGGQSFSTAQAAFRIPNMALGKRRGPRIAVTASAVVISAIGGAQGKGRDGDILAYRSVDGGQSWQGPTRVNDVSASAREGLHAMAAGPDGTLWCVWLDLRNKKTELYASKSTDHGETWTENFLVYRSPDGSICECCHPSIAISRSGVHVLFRNSIQGNRDMYLATSHDGQNFTARRLGTDHWQLNACPMDGGMLSTDAAGNVSTVWRRGGVVYATHDDHATETLVGRGEQPWVASTANDSLAVWTGARPGELFMSTLTEPQPRSIALEASDPVIVSSPDPAGPVIVCWESQRDDNFTIEALAIQPN